MAVTSFFFVDVSRTDKVTKSRARSHVLKGKNAGRKLGHRLKTQCEPDSIRSSNKLVKKHAVACARTDPERGVSTPCSIPLDYSPFNTELITFTYSVDDALQYEYLIKSFLVHVVEALYPPRLCQSLHKPRAYWFHMFSQDQTSLHCAIALLSSLDSFFTGNACLPPGAIYHLGRAVKLVNQRLATQDALCESNLFVVTFLVVHHLVREEHAQAKVHHQGLRKMFELRKHTGHAIQDEYLALKICKTDLDFALHYGTPLFSHRDNMHSIYTSLPLGTLSPNLSLSTSVHLPPPLLHVLHDVMTICSLFNTPTLNFRLDPHLLQEFLVSVGHRVLLIHTLLDLPLEDKVEEAYCIGLSVFVTTLILRFGRERFLRYELLGRCWERCVGALLQEGVESEEGGEEDAMVLWLLFLGGIAGGSEMSRRWLGVRIKQQSEKLGLGEWSEVRECLMRYPWIGAVHDEGGKALWEAVVGDGRGGSVPRERWVGRDAGEHVYVM